MKSLQAALPAKRSIHGSADPKVLSVFGALRRPARLPAGMDLNQSLDGPVASYDPTHAAVLKGSSEDRLYLVPAKLIAVPTPHACSRVPYGGAFVSMLGRVFGSGPGVCTVADSPNSPEAPDGDFCTALSEIDSYAATYNPLIGAAPTPQPVPDGVRTVDYVFPNGKVESRKVTHNLISGPAPADPRQPSIGHKSTAAYGRLLKRWLAKTEPTEIRWHNASGAVIAVHRRPYGWITTQARAVLFELDVVGSDSTAPSTSARTVTQELN